MREVYALHVCWWVRHFSASVQRLVIATRGGYFITLVLFHRVYGINIKQVPASRGHALNKFVEERTDNFKSFFFFLDWV